MLEVIAFSPISLLISFQKIVEILEERLQGLSGFQAHYISELIKEI